jgi:glycerol kinase
MVNGGITANNFVMEFLTDLLDSKVIKSTMPNVSALGAGIFKNLEEVQQLFGERPALNSGKYLEAEKQYAVWNKLIN